MKSVSLAVLLIFCIGCEKVFFEDNPANTSENNFELFWKDFDMYYAQFGIRSIDWDSVYTAIKPLTVNVTDKQLFSILSGEVLKLNDMHVSLYTPYGYSGWKGWGHGKYPSSKLINQCKYLSCSSFTKTSVLEYNEFKSRNIGYIAISTFSGSGSIRKGGYDDRYYYIDNVLAQFKDKDAIIIDVRWNGGGNSLNAETIASRFADKKRLACRQRSKNGPGENDFSDWTDWYIEPKGSFQFTKPVVVLTSRLTSSSAEDFVMYMRELPNVVIVGDTTGGGTGNPIMRELPNGWNFRLSTAYAETADNRLVDGIGIIPDVAVQTTVADSIAGLDRVIETGLEMLVKIK
jgi:carboxyl-terminal processing protease